MRAVIARIRHVSWLVLISCFFLPFTRGCDDAVIVPFQSVDNWGTAVSIGLPFLYPLLLAGGWALFRFMRHERLRRAAAMALYSAAFWLLTWIVHQGIISLHTEAARGVSSLRTGDAVFATIAVLLWGLLALLVRRLSVANVLQMLSLQMTMGSFCWLVYLAGAVGEPLIGAWISLAASLAASSSYVVEFLLGERSTSR